jgi:hypothetical protein
MARRFSKPTKQDITFMLDSVYDTLSGLTLQDTNANLATNSRAVNIIHRYLGLAEKIGYDDKKIEFLNQVRDVYLV